jgi:hypothetical protein
MTCFFTIACLRLAKCRPGWGWSCREGRKCRRPGYAGSTLKGATQTSKATEEISQRIEAIQSDTVGAVDAISEISEVIA